MKKTLFSAAFCLLSTFWANAQITSDGQVYLYAGALESYDQPTIWAATDYNPVFQSVGIRLLVAAAAAEAEIVAEFRLLATKSDIDAYTGSGTGDTEVFNNAVMQHVKNYLEGLSENTGVTFTIN